MIEAYAVFDQPAGSRSFLRLWAKGVHMEKILIIDDSIVQADVLRSLIK